MKILVTGAKGFVGKNLCLELRNIKDGKARCYGDLSIEEVLEYDIDSTPEELETYCKDADFVFNLAGVNRPQNQEEFMQGNFGFASTLLDTLKKYDNKCPVMLSSSQQASLTGRFGNSEYGCSKKAGEDLFLQYEAEFLRNQDKSAESAVYTESAGLTPRVLIYRFPNLYGKWCRPNYNSAVATFCNNIANDLPIQVNDPSVELELLYIDDLIAEMINALKGAEHHCEFEGLKVIPAEEGKYCYCPVTHKATLGQIVDLLNQFKQMPQTLMIPEIPADSFAKRLYSTYLSYLPKEGAIFDLKMNVDNRGSFTELVHTLNCGQVSINISKPGITKGEHWHHTKWEQFIVVKGHGLIQMRSLSPALPTREGEKPYHMADPSLYTELEEKAVEMRKNPTEAESAMWEILRRGNLDAKFRRQHIIGEYIVDFVDLASGLVIEIDGGYHNKPEQKILDTKRTDYLQKQGFSVIRFTNEEVLFKTDETINILNKALSLVGRVGERSVLNYFVSGERIQSVIMLPGYTHNIINLSDTQDLVTVMYCNEIFNPGRPDTYFDPVEGKKYPFGIR
ncbi:MAG: DUF559 domain-containing protein [Bacteroidaceae bacterium]|nr:DUF559 domain-containing protein [Bacteroidaceae bacterium]